MKRRTYRTKTFKKLNVNTWKLKNMFFLTFEIYMKLRIGKCL